MSLTAAELRAVYTVDERPLDRSLQGLGGKVGGAVKGAVGAAAGLFAFSQISSGFLGLTGAASDLNETINKSSVIFGQNAADINQWAGGAAKNLGLSKQQALAAAAGFGDMFSQIGFAGDQAADMSKAVVQMSADLGSFNNLPTEDVAQRISAAFRGEYDSLQALIPNINAARVESEAMAATGKKNASALTAQEKAAAVLAIVNKDGARAMGDFAKTSDGAANAAKIATAEWNDQKAAIGQQLLPVLTSMIGFLRSTAIPAVGKLASFIADDAIPAIKGMAEWIDANRTPLLVVAGILAAIFLPHLIAVAAQSVLTRTALTAMWIASKVGAITAAAAHSAAVVGMIVKWVALGVAAVVQGAITATVWTAKIVGSAVAGAASFALQVARVVGGWILMAVTAVAQGAIQATVWTAQLVAAAVSGAASFAVQAGRVVAGWVLMGAQALIQGARIAAGWLLAMGPVGWVIALVVGLVALIVANWETVKRWTIGAWNAVSGAVSGAWKSVSSAVSSGIDNVVSFVKGLPGKILSGLGNLGSLLLDAGTDMVMGFIRGIGNMAQKAANAAIDVAKKAVNGLKNFLGIGSPSKVFAGFGRNVGQGFVLGMESMHPAVAAEMSRLANTQALGSLTMRRPSGVGAGTGAGPGAGGGAQGGPAAPDKLLNIENYWEQPGSSPAANAAALAVEVRTRPWT